MDIGMPFNEEIEKLIQKYKLPPSSDYLLERYVISNTFLTSTKTDSFDCEYEPAFAPFGVLDPYDDSIEARWNRAGSSYVRLYISEHVNLKDAQAYLKARWSYFKKNVFNKKTGHKSIRRSKNTDRDEIIYTYQEKTRAQLGLNRGEYKDIRIAALLKTEHNINITPENVKKVMHRNKNLRDN
jgi:hypothetical protein